MTATSSRFTSRGASRKARSTVSSLYVGAALLAALAGGLTLQAQGFGFGREELKLVKQFDKDGDGRLNAAERKAARPTAASQGRPPRFGGNFGGAPAPGKQVAPADVRNYPASTSLYDPTALRTVFLQFEAADWEQELADFHDTDVEVPATMTVDGQKYPEVGVHFRGNSSYMMVSAGQKRSLNISLDFARETQALGGYRTLNLLNANSDPGFLRTVLFSHIAGQYVPTPKVNYLRVVINGEFWGIYLNVQQFNKDFTRDFFGSAQGARWKAPGRPNGRAGLEYLGASADQYKAIYEIKTKDTPKSWNDLIQLTRVLNETPLDKLEAALAPILDVDGALRFLAVDLALANSDGYWTRASDYSIYQDPKGVFHVLPYDFNEALSADGGGRGGFGGFSRTGPEPLIGLNDPSKPLRSRLLSVPSLQAKYLGYVRDIAQKHLDWATLGPLARQHHALIAADVKQDTRKLYTNDAFDRDLPSLESFVTARRAMLLR